MAEKSEIPSARVIPQAERPIPLLERAFQLARRGYNSARIRELLNAEGYEMASVLGHMSSNKLCAELNRVAENRTK